MGFAEEELLIVWKKLIGKILSGKPSAKCPFSYIIMEKGGYWVGVFLGGYKIRIVVITKFHPCVLIGGDWFDQVDGKGSF